MPTVPRTSLEEIVAAGREVLRSDGLDGLTMQRVAERVGVRAPSLYKRLQDRAALVRLVAEHVLDEVGGLLRDAAASGDPARDLQALAVALREFARREPAAYGLLFTPLPPAMAPAGSRFAATVEPVLRVCEALVGPERALDAARTVTAWLSGFLRMEAMAGFQLGGSVDGAFEFGIELLAGGLARQGERRAFGSNRLRWPHASPGA
jgi:AcrR family transcriptional regulator